MKRVAFGLLALAAILATLPAPASADHCYAKIYVYGRPAAAPLPPPPYSARVEQTCHALAGSSFESHALAPQASQVMVRVHGDFGPRVPQLSVVLDGLGFANHSFPLLRTQALLGDWHYQMHEWVPLPSGPQKGKLTASVTYPGGTTFTVVYRSVA